MIGSEEKFDFEIRVTRKHFIKDTHYILMGDDRQFIITIVNIFYIKG